MWSFHKRPCSEYKCDRSDWVMTNVQSKDMSNRRGYRCLSKQLVTRSHGGGRRLANLGAGLQADGLPAGQAEHPEDSPRWAQPAGEGKEQGSVSQCGCAAWLELHNHASSLPCFTHHICKLCPYKRVIQFWHTIVAHLLHHSEPLKEHHSHTQNLSLSNLPTQVMFCITNTRIYLGSAHTLIAKHKHHNHSHKAREGFYCAAPEPTEDDFPERLANSKKAQSKEWGRKAVWVGGEDKTGWRNM